MPGIGPRPEETPGLEHLLSHAVRRADRKSPAETGVMSEQPENPPEPPPPEHGNVRTQGETDVDDAVGAADDPD